MEQQKLESAQTAVGSRSADKRKRKVTVGSVWKSKLYGSFEVVDYRGCDNVVVRFIETGFETKTEAGKIRAGNIKDKLSRSVHGVGFIGDGKFAVWDNGKPTKAYSTWSGMIARGYSDKFQDKNPTYKDCKVCDEWHNFQNFAEWYNNNHPNDGGRYELDKDLKVIGNKSYSPETCMFVSVEINHFTIDSGAARGQYMIGVHFDRWRGKIRSQCSNPFTKKMDHLGYFDTEIEAHLAWRKRKSDYAYELAISQENIEVKNALMNWRSALDNFEIHKMDTGNYYEVLCP